MIIFTPILCRPNFLFVIVPHGSSFTKTWYDFVVHAFFIRICFIRILSYHSRLIIPWLKFLSCKNYFVVIYVILKSNTVMTILTDFYLTCILVDSNILLTYTVMFSKFLKSRFAITPKDGLAKAIV